MILTLMQSVDAGSAREAIECPEWSALPALLERLAVERPGWLWSPGVFAGPKRNDEACTGKWAAIIDYDSGEGGLPEAMRTIANKVGHDRIIGHYTKTDGCWRMVVDCGEVTPQQCQSITRELYPLVNGEPESAAISQPWYLPPAGVRVRVVQSPLDAVFDDHALMAAIHLDGDLWFHYPRGGRGPDGIDRSRVDMSIVSRMLAHGCDEATVREVITARGELSSNDSIRSVGRMVAACQKAQATPGVDIYTSPEIHLTVDAAITVVEKDPGVYVRGGTLVHIVQSNGEKDTTNASPVVAVIKPPNLTERLSRGARWFKRDDEGEAKRIQPPGQVASMIVARDQWPTLRPLRGIAETPVIRPDGSVYDSGPWDPVTGYGYRPVGAAKYPITQSPGLPAAAAALAALKEPFAEFPWASSAAILAPIAAIVALLCRPAVGLNVPLFAFDAPLRGTGKTLISQCISVIATGSTAHIGALPDSPEEMRKRLDGYALMAPRLVVFDNADKAVAGGALDAALTCNGKYELRTLGATEIRRCDWSTVIVATGNQMVIDGDTVRRTVLARCVPRTDRPAERQGFKIPDLIGWSFAHRQHLVAAAIDLYRAYALAGYPSQGLGNRGSFEDFVARVGGALAWAGGGNLLDLWSVDRGASDNEDSARRTMIEWLAVRWPDGATARQIADDFDSITASPDRAKAEAELKAADPDWPERMKDLRAQLSTTGSGAQAVGLRLRQWSDIYHEGLRITPVTGGRVTKWQVTE